MSFYCFLIISIINLVKANELSVTRITNIFPHGNNSHNGSIVGFADIDGNRFTDVFYLNTDGTELRVLLMEHKHVHSDQVLFRMSRHLLHQYGAIRSIILNDFGGQSQLDVVILVGHMHGPYFAMYYNNIGNFAYDAEPIALLSKNVFATFEQQPLLFHYDGDNLPDLLGIDSKEHQWNVWQYKNKQWSFHAILDLKVFRNTTKPIHSLFFDIDSDYSSEVMLTDYIKKKFMFYGRPSASDTIDFSKTKKEIDFPEHASQFTPPLVADWCLNGTAGMLLGYCFYSNCYEKSAKLAVFNTKDGNNWIKHEIINFFWITTNHIHLKLPTHPLVSPLRIIDVNLDGYPDVITTTYNKHIRKFSIGAFINTCNRGTLNFQFARTDTNITSAIPFDFMENGKSDIFSNDLRKIKLYTIRFGPNHSKNVNYLKVSVLPGYCSKGTCPVPMISKNNIYPYSLPYGIPGSGISLNLEINHNNNTMFIKGYLGSDTSYLALQLPYYLFILNENMSVNSLTVGLFKGRPSLRSFDIVTSMVHAIINTVDINNPEKWSVELISKNFHKASSSNVGVLHGFLCFIVICFVILLVMLSFKYARQHQKTRKGQSVELMSSIE